MTDQWWIFQCLGLVAVLAAVLRGGVRGGGCDD